jgi:CheY-like chemotaxis protein
MHDRRILVVDPGDESRDAWVQFLSEGGYTVTVVASNRADALPHLRREDVPDMIVFDLPWLAAQVEACQVGNAV